MIVRRAAALILVAALLGACASSPVTPSSATAPATSALSASATAIVIQSTTPTETPVPTEAPAATPAPTTAPTETPNPPTPVPKPPRSLKPGQTPGPTPINIGAMLTATISVLSLGDGPVDIVVNLIDPDSGQATQVATMRLQTLDGDAEPVLPGVYAVAFKRPAETKAVTCTLHVKDGEAYDFVTTDRTVAVTKNQQPATSAAELLAQSSSLCKP